MAKRKGGGTAAKIIKVTLLILLVVILLAGAFVGITYATNGYGGACPTFLTSVNGDLIISSRNMSIPDGSTVRVYSFEDYSLAVYASEPADDGDFALTVDGEEHLYSEYAGEDMTAGFTFTQSDGGVMVTYGGTNDILSAALGADVTVSEGSEAIFELRITSGKSTLSLTFSPSYELSIDHVTGEPDGNLIH